jgi:predicted RNA-binding protein with PUA-like domain
VGKSNGGKSGAGGERGAGGKSNAAGSSGGGSRKKGASRSYWLVKSEPSTYSWDDLWNSPGRTTFWDGVRNYQARNILRDDMKVGDGILFYHSSTEPAAVMGIAEVVREGYPDHTAFDAKSDHYDPKSRAGDPTWYMVDIRAVRAFAEPVTLARLREADGLENMMLLKRGSRLSVQPVTAEEWEIVTALGVTV